MEYLQTSTKTGNQEASFYISSGSSISIETEAANDFDKANILRGYLEWIPDPKQAKIQVYLCCNPMDSKMEQHAIMVKLKSKIKKKLESDYDIEFKIIDMNAGYENNILVSAEDRIKQIKICQQESLSTNFIALIGQKYWSLSIFPTIDLQVFSALRKTSKRYFIPNAGLLDNFYEKDDNFIPPAYRLKTKESAKNFNDKINELEIVLKMATEKATKDGLITKEQSNRFLVSCFEKELTIGVLEAHRKYLTKCVCYVRTVQSMEYDMCLERIKNFIDILPSSNEVDSSYVTNDLINKVAKQRMEYIKDNKIPQVITESNGQLKVYKCDVKWIPQVGIDAQKHASYLDDLSNEIYNTVIKTAESNVKDIRDSQEYSEILCHCYIAKSLYEKHQEISTGELREVQQYITNQSNKPLLLRGPPASGKSFLIANIASEVMEWFESDATPICVTRFVGQTYSSSFMVLLLNNICSQFESYFNMNCEDDDRLNLYCTDCLHLKKRLLSLLENATFYQPIILLIDGINQLDDIHTFQTWSSWLPINLPDYVKIVVSLDHTCYNILDLLQDQRMEELEIVDVHLINRKTYSYVLRHMLASENRCITPGQHTFALQAGFLDGQQKVTTTTPLMADIVHAHARRWSSTTNINLKTLGTGEQNSIQRFMHILEAKYGKSFIKYAASLITVSKFGITESDLEEILSNFSLTKKEALSKMNSSEDSTLPESVLTLNLANFLEDISFLLISKYIHGCKVFCWSNTLVHKILTSLYNSTKTKALELLLKQYLNYSNHGSYYSNHSTPLKTLHVALSLPNLFEETNNQISALKTCYLNFFWLSSMTKAFGIIFTLFTLKTAFNKNKERSILILEQCLRISLPMIKRSPASFSGELLSRTLTFSNTFPLLKDLITQCTSTTNSNPSIILPAGVINHIPGAPLRVSFHENFPIAGGLATYETLTGFGLVYCSEKHIKWFNMLTGESLKEMVFTNEITWMKLSSDSQYVMVYIKHDLSLFIIKQQDCHCQDKFSLQDCFKDSSLVSNCGENYLVIWSTNKCGQVLVIDIKQGIILHSYICKNSIEKCVISTNEVFIFNVHLPQSISIFDIKEGIMVCMIQPPTELTDPMVDIYEVFSRYLITVQESGCVHVWEINQKPSFNYVNELNTRHYGQDNSLKVVSTALSNNNKQLAVIKNQEIYIWNLENGSNNIIESRKDENFAIANFQNNYLFVAMSNFHLGIYIWKLERDYPATCMAILDGHTSNLSHIIMPYSSDNVKNKWAVSVSNKNTINIWNLENVPLIPTPIITGRSILKVLTIGKVAVSIDETTKIAVWGVLNGDILFYLEHDSPVTQCVVAKNSFRLITADDLGFQYIWDLENGMNIFKIKSPKVSALVISPNEQMMVSIFQENENKEISRAAARVWRLDTAQQVCTFNSTLQDAQITSQNTFVVGISANGQLNAISVWIGVLTKVLGDTTNTLISLQALSKHDQVITLDSNNNVIVWGLEKEEILISLNIHQEEITRAFFSESGAVMVTVDGSGKMRALDVTRGNMISIRSNLQPLMIEIGRKGIYFTFISASSNPNSTKNEILYDLNVVKVTTSQVIANYPLEFVPTCMFMSPSGKRVAIGTAEGKVLVFNINTTEITPVDSSNFKEKLTQRKVFNSKPNPDVDWNDHELSYDESYEPSLSPSSSSYSPNVKRALNSQPTKKKIHLGPMNMQKSPPNKSVNMSRISNSSKVKVFM